MGADLDCLNQTEKHARRAKIPVDCACPQPALTLFPVFKGLHRRPVIRIRPGDHGDLVTVHRKPLTFPHSPFVRGRHAYMNRALLDISIAVFQECAAEEGSIPAARDPPWRVHPRRRPDRRGFGNPGGRVLKPRRFTLPGPLKSRQARLFRRLPAETYAPPLATKKGLAKSMSALP